MSRLLRPIVSATSSHALETAACLALWQCLPEWSSTLAAQVGLATLLTFICLYSRQPTADSSAAFYAACDLLNA